MIIRYFPESDLRKGHIGLAIIAKREGVDVKSLGHGEYLIFANRAQNRVKLYAGGNVIAYLKLDKGRIDPRTISLIPRYFTGHKIRYDDALREVLGKEFPKFNWKKAP